MQLATGFAPLVGTHPKILILGSLPSEASIRANQYYAHPRNAFWFIMGELFGFDPALPYAQRSAIITAAGLAVWDVLGAARRQGSLDSAIEVNTAVVNNFPTFFTQHPTIHTIFGNGGKATDLYHKHVLPNLSATPHLQHIIKLPSSSPANARLRPQEKLRQWQPILHALAN
jgi:double-stranded uracil-DNA glycosylase